MAPLARGALVAVLALFLGAQGARGAHAHAVLLESSPAADAVLAAAPAQIALRFNEPVRPAVIKLLRARDAASVDLGPPATVDHELRLPLPADLPRGSYVLSYRVTSADGHPVVGSLLFAIGVPDHAAPHAALDGHEGVWSVVGIAART
ncbi:MAG: copper resistance CopC family protein, partial [Geminicoccaceae bacterium]